MIDLNPKQSNPAELSGYNPVYNQTIVDSAILNADLYDPVVQYSEGPFTDLELSTKFTQSGSTTFNGGYMKDLAGFVHFRGQVVTTMATSAWDTIGTLPKGYRPSKTVILVTIATPGALRIDVKPDGSVLAGDALGSGDWVSLEGLAFYADT